MARSARKLTAKTKREIAIAASRSNREADTAYWLTFVPIGVDSAPPLQHLVPSPDDRWRVMLPGNPKSNPEFIERAIAQFESNHSVGSWKELAERYYADERYIP